jgi:LAS superfamily LD-carboxypeptidase LdcB
VEKPFSKFIFAFIFLLAIVFIFTPYFTTDFLDLRQKKENDEMRQKLLAEEALREKIKKEAEEKLYLMGKFDQTKREDFVEISSEYTLGGIKMYTRKETHEAFLKMHKSALLEGIDLRIVSATRNFEYQKNLWNDKWTGVTFVNGKDLSKSMPDGIERFEKILEYSAAPGTSRHHWGTDIDINGVSPTYFDTPEGMKQYEWLKANAPLFGFCQTYNEKGADRQSGYNEEKWHWSYLPLAKSFTQRYKELIKNEDIKGFLGDEYALHFNLIQNYVLSINPDCM